MRPPATCATRDVLTGVLAERRRRHRRGVGRGRLRASAGDDREGAHRVRREPRGVGRADVHRRRCGPCSSASSTARRRRRGRRRARSNACSTTSSGRTSTSSSTRASPADVTDIRERTPRRIRPPSTGGVAWPNVLTMSELYFDRKMSDVEGLMWRLEKDPYLTSTFGNVTILDRKPDVDRLRRRFERASIAIPRLRQRVQPAPGNVSPPTWVEDPDFTIENHVRHIALPKPGSMRQLLDLASLIVADPFDRTRPLWQFVRRRRAPRRQVGAHPEDAPHGHRRRARRPTLAAVPRLRARRARPAAAPAARRRRATKPPNPPASTASGRSSPAASGCRSASPARCVTCSPTRASLPKAGTAAADTFRGIVSQLADTDKARSPLWTARSLRRHIEVTRAPFRETKDAAARLGGTLNTAFMTAAADAASRYHVEMGSPTEALRASMAVSTRTESSGANAFSVIRMLVPDRRDADRRAVRRHPRGHRGRQGAEQVGRARHARRRRLRVADERRHPARPPADADRRLRHVERAGRADGDVRRRRPAARELRRSARSPASRSTSRCCRTSAASTWGSTSTPPRSTDPDAVEATASSARSPNCSSVLMQPRGPGQAGVTATSVGSTGLAVSSVAHVEQDVGDLAGRHQLAGHDLAEGLVDHAERFTDDRVARSPAHRSQP